MGYFPSQGPILAPGDIIWSWDALGPIGAFGYASGTPAGVAWGVANRAFFYPIRLSYPFTVNSAMCMNGGTMAGNFDIGVYDPAGRRLISCGSTAQAGANAVQSVSTTATYLVPGLYYLAMATNSSTAQVWGRSGGATPWSVDLLKAAGCCTMETAFALPATATYATMASGLMLAFGISQRSVI